MLESIKYLKSLENSHISCTDENQNVTFHDTICEIGILRPLNYNLAHIVRMQCRYKKSNDRRIFMAKKPLYVDLV